jgi:hypothetical protein
LTFNNLLSITVLCYESAPFFWQTGDVAKKKKKIQWMLCAISRDEQSSMTGNESDNSPRVNAININISSLKPDDSPPRCPPTPLPLKFD